MRKFRIVNRKHYVFTEHGGRDYLTEIIRPEIQMRVLYFFWITIKTFICNRKFIAEQDAQHLLDRLNRKYYYE